MQSQGSQIQPGLLPVVSAVQIAFLNSITMPALLMTFVITAAMSKLIKVVGSLSYFHVETHLAQRCSPVIAVAQLAVGQVSFIFRHVLGIKKIVLKNIFRNDTCC